MYVQHEHTIAFLTLDTRHHSIARLLLLAKGISTIIMISHSYRYFFVILAFISFYRSLHGSAFSVAVLCNNNRTDKSNRLLTLQRFVSGKDFIDAIVTKNGEDRPFQRYTHMIAIPMETNHDLMLELESVQRAVLYHCPLLINSCIVPALTRMPLLLVDTRNSANDGLGPGRFDSQSTPSASNDLLTSRDPITRALYTTVQQVVRDTINIVMDFSYDSYDQVIRDPLSSPLDGITRNSTLDPLTGRNGVNEANIKPLVISFKGLEVDGDDNSILYAIGKEDDEAQKLRHVVMDIASRIRGQYGWDVAFPPDFNLEKKTQGHEVQYWRPRVPFMRLPTNFRETLPNPKGLDGEWEFYSPEEKANYIRFPEEGGNGISPIFWYQWWEDPLCNGNAIRFVFYIHFPILSLDILFYTSLAISFKKKE